VNQSYREELKRRLIRNDAGEVDYLTFDARCIRTFGPAAGTFLRQLVYWVGKEHDQEGWIYKTQVEMEQETGLSRRHQEKARNILLSQGVLKERKKGTPRMLWYWVDLEALLDMMETPHSTLNQWARKQENNAAETTDIGEGVSQDRITEHADEIDSTARASRNGSTHPASEDDSSAPASEDDTTYRPITESTSETTPESSSANYSSENPNLQFGKGHVSRGLSPQQEIKIADPPKPSVGGLELNRIYYLLVDTPGSEPYLALESYQEGSLSLQDLASEVCFALTGSRDQRELYVDPVRRMVEELAIDDGVSH
jgi:hypothetical protein